MNWLKATLLAGLVFTGTICFGCQANSQATADTRSQRLVVSRASTMVMPGPALLGLTGDNQWLAQEQQQLMGRRDALLNVGRVPAFAPVYVAQIRTWDQQQIINGRPNEFFIRTNRSLETSGPR